MKKSLFLILGLVIGSSAFSQKEDSLFIRKIYDEALVEGEAYDNLRYLCKEIGARITGSAEAEMAIQWGKSVLDEAGLDNVYLQEVEVPHWERGTKEAAWIQQGDDKPIKLDIIALGGSIGTDGIMSGEIVRLDALEDIYDTPEEDVKGKVVFYDKAFDQRFLSTGMAYGGCYIQRYKGAIEASKKGAIGVIIRSLASSTDDHPHTGSMAYEDSTRKIPAAAVSTENSDLIRSMLEKGPVTLTMEMDCRWYGNIKSHNVIGELNGSEDDKIITFGGHLDSWDVGEGAHDDGAGIVHCIEAIRILKKLGYQPKHKLRCVLFMNEENGNYGGKNYASIAEEKKEEHIVALETDAGGFLPVGFNIRGNEEQIKWVQEISAVLEDFELLRFKPGFSGVDISPLKDYFPGMLQLGLAINTQRYFDYHHSETDVFENVNKRELELGAAAMAAMVYLIDKYYE
ncbi:MAG: M20/M25/M40 family metallo-hydrolase [Crocinitomicaceae bacterium]|nr:M20/M25/M40 family metallo-hydrolase [Crocinitomicaceae bacterium]